MIKKLRTSGKKEKHKKIHEETTGFPFPFEFSKLCLMSEANIITLSNVALNSYRGKYLSQLLVRALKRYKGNEICFIQLGK